MEVIRWGSGPVCFELRSPDSDVIEAASAVFGKWTAPASARLEGKWEVRRSEGGIAIDPMPRPPDSGALPEVRSLEHAVTMVEYAAMWRIVEKCNHLLCFHSALLSKDGRGVAIVGPSTAGKSTLATALWRSGWDFLCDDLTITSGSRAAPGPRRVSLRETSRHLVGEDLWQSIQQTRGYQRTHAGCLFHPVQRAGEAPEVELCAVVFLMRNGAHADATGPTELVPAAAALALLPYTNLVRTVSFPEALAPIAGLMAAVPAYDLPRGPLPQMVSSVETFLSRQPASFINLAKVP